MNKLCIYHKGCTDGFGAALAVFMKFPSTEFLPASYGEDPPDVTGMDVVLVDFSYKRDVLIAMASKANSILVIDHHKTAEADLVDLPSNVTVHFNMKKSGAVLSWEYFLPSEDIPSLIAHIQDRDLWKFELPNTKPIIAALGLYDHNFHVWRSLVEGTCLGLLKEGNVLLKQQQKHITQLIDQGVYRSEILGYDIPTLNAPYFYASDIGEILCKGEPFSATYSHSGDKKIYSLRSNEDGIDVSVIAEKFGGGGHKHAAGFQVQSSECSI